MKDMFDSDKIREIRMMHNMLSKSFHQISWGINGPTEIRTLEKSHDQPVNAIAATSLLKASPCGFSIRR